MTTGNSSQLHAYSYPVAPDRRKVSAPAGDTRLASHIMLKRPPPPPLHTGANAIFSATATITEPHKVSFAHAPSSTSPLIPSKRPPPGAKQAQNHSPVNNHNPVNGVQPRSSTRQRRESQKPGDGNLRTQRMNSHGGRAPASEQAELERPRQIQRLPPQPYGKRMALMDEGLEHSCSSY